MAIEEAAGHKHNGDRGGKRNYNRHNLTAPTTGCLGPIRAKATAGWASDGVTGIHPGLQLQAGVGESVLARL